MSDQHQNSNRPVEKHRDGSIEVAIWRRETDNGPVFNTERNRSYRDQEGNWQRTNVIPERDLLKAARLDQKAYETIQQLRDQEREKYVERQSGRPRKRDQRQER